MIVSEGIKFFPADFILHFQGKEIPLRGLLSELGITRVTAVESNPPDWKDSFGKEYDIQLGSLTVKGLLVQHFDTGGACVLVRFPNLTEEDRNKIRRLVEAKGVFPGWQRKLPRISVEDTDSELPLPSLCTVRFAGQEVFVEVMNFTLGGLGIKSMGSQLAPARVGMQLQFDLITNRGEIIANSTAEIMNVSVHDLPGVEGKGASSAIRYLGLKIREMSLDGKTAYKNLIRDYCLAVQKNQKAAK